MNRPPQDERHFWLPTPDPDRRALVRHAFRGARWESERSAETVCGKEVAMAKPHEMDWCTAPTCADCNRALIGEQRP